PPAGPVWKRPVPVLAAALIGVLALAGVRLHGRAKLAVPPAEANSLAVFTFENLKDPEDPERLGEILQELLITDLSGLEALKVFSSQRLSDIERQLERRGSNAADRGITNEVATHAGAQTMLTGSLSHLGDTWILTAQLSDVERGTVLKSKRIDGDDLYAMVDQLTAEIQSELAIETPTEIAARSIKEKTSTSKEAWSHYLGGVDHLNANQFNEAVLELTRAVEIDPGFGQAYYKLGIATWWLYSDAGAGQEQIIHLLENELYASKKEKEMAEGMLLVIQNKWSEAFPVLRRVTHTYPDEKHAWYGLGEAQFHFPGGSQQHESLEAFERAVALDPDFLLPYWHIFDVLWGEKRYDEAIARAAALIEHDPQNPLWHRYRAGSVAFRGDREETQKVLAEALTYNTTAEDQRELYHLVALSIANLGYVDRAEGYLRQALQVDPGHDDPRIVRQLMGYLWDQRKFDEVEAQLHELLVRDPMNDRLLEDLFRVYMAKNEYEKAHQLALDLVRKEADDPRWYRYWAQCTIYNGDEEANARVIREAIERNSSADDRRNLFGAIGAAYSHTGNHNKAKEYFQKAIAVDPEQDYPNYFSEIGFQDLRRGCYDEAEVWIRKAMKLAPKNVHHLITLAHVNVERGEFEEAVRNLEEVLEILPPSELFPFLAMSLKVFTGDLQEVDRKLAVEETSLATETQKWEFLYSRPWKLPFGVAWSYLLAGHYERAAEVFQWAQSFELNQRDPVAYEGLGWTYLCLGDHGRAEQAFLAGLEIGYDHRSTLYGLAVLKLLQGEPESAESYVERALEGPPHVAFSRLLATVYAAQERYVEARALAEEALAMDSSRASHELLAWILIAGELDIQKGIEVAKRAVEIPIRFSEVEKALPHRASAEHSLGLAYLKQGRTDLATKHLQRAAVLQPNRTSIHLDLQRALGLLSGTQ
ncbi:MAG: tetratricopeptide repeat protein, partial [Candidatus Krumholzibacteriia bacterium]